MTPTLLFDIPLCGGMKNQFQAARQIREAGARVELLCAEPAESLAAWPAYQAAGGASLGVQHLDAFEPVAATPALPGACDAAEVEAMEETLERRPRAVFNALRKAYDEELRRFARALDTIKPDALVIADDAIACTMALVSLAKARGLPVYCFPYGNGRADSLVAEIELRETAGTNFSRQSPGGDAVAKRFPKWLMTEPLADRIFLRPEVILARESLGVTIDGPWRIYGSQADRFFATGQVMADAVVADGFSPDKIDLAGSPSGPVVHAALDEDEAARAAFRQPKRLREGELSVVFAPPPSYHASRLDDMALSKRGPHDYAAMIENMLAPFLGQPGVSVTLSAHPATAPAELAVFADLGLTPSEEYVLTLLPRCDLLLADFSTTVAWATACGKPVLNYDVYGFDQHIYDGAPGVLTVADPDEYAALAARLRDDEAFWRSTVQAQCAVAQDWGVIGPDFPDLVLERLREDMAAEG